VPKNGTPFCCAISPAGHRDTARRPAEDSSSALLLDELRDVLLRDVDLGLGVAPDELRRPPEDAAAALISSTAICAARNWSSPCVKYGPVARVVHPQLHRALRPQPTPDGSPAPRRTPRRQPRSARNGRCSLQSPLCSLMVRRRAAAAVARRRSSRPRTLRKFNSEISRPSLLATALKKAHGLLHTDRADHLRRRPPAPPHGTRMTSDNRIDQQCPRASPRSSGDQHPGCACRAWPPRDAAAAAGRSPAGSCPLRLIIPSRNGGASGTAVISGTRTISWTSSIRDAEQLLPMPRPRSAFPWPSPSPLAITGRCHDFRYSHIACQGKESFKNKEIGSASSDGGRAIVTDSRRDAR